MYKKGDKIVIIDEDSKHFEKSATVIGEKQNLGIGERRWQIALDEYEDRKYHMTFIFNDSNIISYKIWNRDNKLNQIL